MSRTYKIQTMAGLLELPSVTTIIGDCTDKSGPLTWWAAGAACEWIRQNCATDGSGAYLVNDGDLEKAKRNFRSVSKTALDVGTAVHAAIEEWLKTGKEPVNPGDQVMAGFVAFLEWADVHRLETIATEKTVHGEGWAGTLDFYGKLDGEPWVADWKTSKDIYPEYRYQIAAYAEGIAATADVPFMVPRTGILRVDKETGLPEWVETTKTHADDYFVFMRMVSLYMAKHPAAAKKCGYFDPPF